MRLLLVKMSSMGDIIHNMPLVHDIKQHYPEAIIDWVVEESFVELARLNPLVERIIPVAMRRWKKAIFSKNTWVEFLKFKKNLQTCRYDAILDTQGLIKSAVIAKLAHGISYGQNSNTARERLAGYLVRNSLDIPRNLHAITRNRLVGALALNYSTDDNSTHYDMQFNHELNPVLTDLLPKNCIMLFHSTARAAKHWPNECWIALGLYLNARGYALALPWGSATEKQRAESIANSLKDALVLPKLSIVQLAGLMRDTKACVGLDTGLTHIAVALNIPTLAIFTDTHLWQAGTKPSPQGCAITIGGKPDLPNVKASIDAFNQLMVMKHASSQPN
ncbi:lipopolysaccharide heptosyltransferase I [Methylotenera sp.]|uniref:lipopolysaccharide heptosyltransferase I n=1 Tax=Methylotenera sp. TaxID=2051956 RepID=UPI0027302BAE|nr:lipopolysaccharide heptosyltransferase I [Methylotenera sp.]MDP2070948.1 lipopolysaccharide heptosyltransferase I [Methylotenera sp.]MDP3005822.1 lipopolysaccharide heptosyltransferase I [Methylotenera sp.]